jgi:hypothetical protein
MYSFSEGHTSKSFSWLIETVARNRARDAARLCVDVGAQLMVRPLLEQLMEHEGEEWPIALVRPRGLVRLFHGIVDDPADEMVVDAETGAPGWLRNQILQHEWFDRTQGIMAWTAQDPQHVGMLMAMM